jgi:hypothetical protein
MLFFDDRTDEYVLHVRVTPRGVQMLEDRVEVELLLKPTGCPPEEKRKDAVAPAASPRPNQLASLSLCSEAIE